jgi:hypothetical protein
MRMLDYMGRWLNSAVHDGWHWVTTLNLQEWLLLLGITAAAGFLCMRGFGSRTQY